MVKQEKNRKEKRYGNNKNGFKETAGGDNWTKVQLQRDDSFGTSDG